MKSFVIKVLVFIVLSGAVVVLFGCGDAPTVPPPPGDYNVLLYYAVAADGEDRFDVKADSINQSFELVQQYLQDSLGVRFKSLGVVEKLPRLEQPEAYLRGINTVAWFDKLLNLPANSVALVYYDGPHDTTCAWAGYPPWVPYQVAVKHLKAEPWTVRVAGTYWTCATFPFLRWWHGSRNGTTWLYPRGYHEWNALHELLHTLGMVPRGLPGVNNVGHVTDSNSDVMSQAPRITTFRTFGPQYRNLIVDSPFTEVP